MNKSVQDNINESLKQFRESLAEMQRSRESLENVLLGLGWIVKLSGMGTTYTIKNKHAENIQLTQIHRAMRFTKQDAETVAKNVQNGAGEKGIAIHIRPALDIAIDEMQQLIQHLESATQIGQTKN